MRKLLVIIENHYISSHYKDAKYVLHFTASKEKRDFGSLSKFRFQISRTFVNSHVSRGRKADKWLPARLCRRTSPVYMYVYICTCIDIFPCERNIKSSHLATHSLSVALLYIKRDSKDICSPGAHFQLSSIVVSTLLLDFLQIIMLISQFRAVHLYDTIEIDIFDKTTRYHIFPFSLFLQLKGF